MSKVDLKVLNKHWDIEYELERYSLLDEVVIYKLKDTDDLLDESLEYLCGDLKINNSENIKLCMRNLFKHSDSLFQIEPVYGSDMFINDCLEIKTSSKKNESNSFSFEIPCNFNNELKVVCVRVYYSMENESYYLVMRKLPYVSKYMDNMYNRILKDYITGLYSKVVAFKDLNDFKLVKGNYLVFIDIDNFKAINDVYGHLEGDRILSKLGYVVRNVRLENNGEVNGYRFGGDEFLLIFNNTSKDDVIRYLEDVKSMFNSLECDLSSITFSAGIVEANNNISNYDRLLLCADKAMYIAKNLDDIYYYMPNKEALDIIKEYDLDFE